MPNCSFTFEYIQNCFTCCCFFEQISIENFLSYFLVLLGGYETSLGLSGTFLRNLPQDFWYAFMKPTLDCANTINQQNCFTPAIVPFALTPPFVLKLNKFRIIGTPVKFCQKLNKFAILSPEILSSANLEAKYYQMLNLILHKKSKARNGKLKF